MSLVPGAMRLRFVALALLAGARALRAKFYCQVSVVLDQWSLKTLPAVYTSGAGYRLNQSRAFVRELR